MDTTRAYKGNFWVAGEPNKKNGLLKFNEDLAYIDLFDSFDKNLFATIQTKSDFRKEICCIYGELDNGQFCVLHQCRLQLSGNPFGGLMSTIIQFDYLFYSSNQDLLNKPKYISIGFSFNTLFHWAGVNPIEAEIDENGEMYMKRQDLTNDKNELFENEEYSLSLYFPTQMPMLTFEKQLKLNQNAKLSLKLKKGQGIFEGFELIEKIYEIFILLRGDKVEKDNIYDLVSEKEDEYYYCYLNKKRFRNTQGYSRYERGRIFDREDLKDFDINIFFHKWFDLYKLYSYPIEIIIKCLSHYHMDRQHKFMSLMYGLEYIYGKDVDNELATNYHTENDNILINELEKSFSDKINKQNLIGKVRSRLEKNRKLSEKFKAFFKQLDIPISGLFGEDSDDFVDKIVNTRNNFAHVNEKEPRIMFDDLHLYNTKIEIVLLFVLYLKLGFSKEKIQQKIKRCDKFQNVIRYRQN